MGFRTGALLIVLLLIAALAVLNWGAVIAPISVSLGFIHVTAPFGLVMLSLTALLALILIAHIVLLHGSAFRDARRYAKEMQAQRDIADKAEASRFTELRSFLETKESSHLAHNAERHSALLLRLEKLETSLSRRLEMSSQALPGQSSD